MINRDTMTSYNFQLNLSSEDQQTLFTIAKRRNISLEDLITEMIHSYCGTFRSEEQQLLWALSCMRYIVSSPQVSTTDSSLQSEKDNEKKTMDGIIHSLQNELERTKKEFDSWKKEIDSQLRTISPQVNRQDVNTRENEYQEKLSKITKDEINESDQKQRPSLDLFENMKKILQYPEPDSEKLPKEIYGDHETDMLHPVIEAVDYHELANLDDEKEYSQTEAAVILGVTTKMIRKLAKDGDINSRKSGRTLLFFGKDIKTYIKANKN